MRKVLTRKEFLKVAGAGGAGLALLGTSAVSAGCSYLPIGGPRMNVILIIIDSLRRDHIGAYGNDWIKTPNLDALARESLRFTRPYPDSIPTICSRRAIHTGMKTWPFRNFTPVKGEDFQPAGWQPVPQDQTMLSEILLEKGFDTNLITDTLHLFRASYDFQRGFNVFNFIRGQERDRYRSMLSISEKDVDGKTVPGNTGGMREKVRQYLANTAHRKTEEDWFSPQVFLRASEYLELARGGQPFFLVVDSFDPHEPWDPPEKYANLYGEPYGNSEPIVPNYSDDSWIEEKELKRMRQLYAGEVTMADHWLGAFLNKMNDLGFMDNTLLMVLSDHGVSLGEHGYTGKVDRALWPELTDTFFFIRHPGGKGAGQTSDYYASTHDIAPTVLGTMGIERPEQMTGQDLSVILEGKEPEKRDHFTLGYNNYSWTRDDRYVMSSRNDGAEARLYDTEKDPEMDKDISRDNPDVVKRMFNDYIIKDAGGEMPPMY